MNAATERVRFNREVAPNLANLISRSARPDDPKPSTRFGYFSTVDELIIVAGVQERKDCDLALAYGMTLRNSRRLVLVLPKEYSFATQQRLPFLDSKTRPTLRIHDVPYGGGAPETKPPIVLVSASDAETEFRGKLRSLSLTSTEELYKASTAAHLGDRSPRVEGLVDWATSHPDLDPGHRRGERSWHCMGQRVLSIKGTAKDRLEIRAGIHFTTSDHKIKPHIIIGKALLPAAKMTDIQEAVTKAIDRRLVGDFCKPDEHWLQAVIRRRPELVGVEQPALREVPAWRPSGGPKKWGRGYIDLLGIDGQGDLRIVETKIAANVDDLLIFQGLDYAVWARVYEEALRNRLGIHRRARTVVHYVIGATPATGDDHVSSYAAAQAKALEIPWRFQVIRNWFNPGDSNTMIATAEVLPKDQLP